MSRSPRAQGATALLDGDGSGQPDTARRPHCLEVLLLTFRLQGAVVDTLGAVSREFNLTPTEAVAMIRLFDGPAPVSGVARAAGLRPNGASILVDRLFERELVTRQRSRDDQRVVTVHLTDAGRGIAEEMRSRLEREMNPLLAPLSTSDRDRLVGSLRRVVAP